jgi:hypothetical protein
MISFWDVILISSCKSENTIRISLENNVELIATDHPKIQNLLCCNGILVSKDFLVVNDWCSDSGFFHVFRYFPVEKGMVFSSKGRGPGEYITPFFYKNIIDESGGLSFDIYDLNLKEYASFNITDTGSQKSFNENSFIIDKGGIPDKIFPCINLTYTDSCFFGNDISFDNGLFFIYDLKTNKKKYAGFIPLDFYRKNNLTNQNLVYENKLVVNKEKGKISVGMSYFNQVHFYNTNGTHLKSISISEDILPVLNKDRLASAESPLYCLDLYATKDYVYVLWGGEPIKDYRANKVSDSYVLVFDWNGEHIKTYKIKNSAFIGVNPANTVLFGSGISSDGTTSICSYNIKND